MSKIIKFNNKLSYFLNLIDQRESEGDLWGVLEATRSAKSYAKTKMEKEGLDLLMGQVYFDMGQYALSCEYFFRAVHIPHLRSACFFGVARNLICVKKFNLALDYLELTLKWDLSNAFTGAVLEWTHHIKQNMNKTDYEYENLILSAKKFLLAGEKLKAREILQTLKSSETTMSLMAFCNLLEEDFSTAEKIAKEVLLEFPFNVLAISVMIEVNKHKNNQSMVEKYLERLYLNETDSPEDLLKIAMIFSGEKKFQKASIFFEKLVIKDQFNAKNYLYYALCLFNLQKIEDALFNLSKARWLDIENPLYLFFYDLVKTNDLPSIVEIKSRLPKEIERQKISNLLDIFYSGTFDKEVAKSYFLLDDVAWSFSLKDFELTHQSSSALCNSGNKKATQLIKKLLLSPKPNARQKFIITKNALLSKNFFNINFVCNLRYSSFQISKNELTRIKNINVRTGICEAMSYVECFFPDEMLVCAISKKGFNVQNKDFLKQLDSKKIACFLLFDYPLIFASACTFFDVESKEIEKLTKFCTGQSEVKNE